MNTPVIIRGTFTNQVFVPEGPMPKVEGRAELIVYRQSANEISQPCPSIFDCFGKAEPLRSAEDIDAQLILQR